MGGVVVARYGANPLQVINNVKDKINEICPGLPKKTLPNGVESQLTIVPFYDRSRTDLRNARHTGRSPVAPDTHHNIGNHCYDL